MELREVKQRFFTFRNGLLADMLRKQCQTPHKLIFGLNLPQIKGIAAEIGTDAQLAEQLWRDADCRESRLLAPMVQPPCPEVLSWMMEVRSVEEADVVCHSLLRKCPEALEAAVATAESDDPLARYCALRLLMNLMPQAASVAVAVIDKVPFHHLTDAVVRQIRIYVSDL